jgi:nitroreductase
MATPLGDPPFVPLDYTPRTGEQMLARARTFRADMATRRSARFFSDRELPAGLLDECIATAALAPSGANRQPWTFVVVRDPALKREIRLAAEEEERKLYHERISDEWREALAPLGTDEHKPFLETAPALIVVLRHVHDVEEGRKVTNYYTQESVGIASGFLLCALHMAGLVTLTHTPSPMGFLQEILKRPKQERAYLLIPVGYPTEDCVVPNLTKKELEEVRVEV